MPNCGHVTNRVHALQSHRADGECSGMTDLLHHALQGRAMSCPMTSLTEFCRCPTHFQKSHHIMTSLTEFCRCPTEFWDHAIPWRHWPSYQVSDRLLTSRHTMTSYRDVTDRIVQVSDPFSENDPFSEITVNRPSCTSESPHLSGTVSMMAIGSFERESFRLVELSKRVSHWSMECVLQRPQLRVK